MANVAEIEKEFKEFGRKIRRLKQMESELAGLDTRGYEAEERSIRSKLKNPQAVDEVESELNALKRAIGAGGTATVRARSAELLPAKYETLGLVGSGGFADVYKARRKEDGLIVAMKIPKVKPNETTPVDDFLKEAEIWSKLEHPYIVNVVEYGTKPVPWIAMEYMDNGSLRQMIGKLSLRDAMSTAIKLCDALCYTHNHYGIIHRDIKPENILYDKNNNPKLADWGLVKVMLSLTKKEVGMTLQYASPEQTNSDKYGKTDRQTDIYQLGAVLYEMVTGQNPIKGENPAEIVWNITQGEIRKPSEVKPGLPETLDDIILKSLAKRKEDRYSYMPEMLVALKEFARSMK